MKNLEFCDFIIAVRPGFNLSFKFSPVPFDSYIIPTLYDAYINHL